MSNNKNNEEKVNVIDTLNEGEIPPVEDANDDDKLVDPKDLDEAIKIVERNKKIKAAGEKALNVAKKAGLILLGVAIGGIAFKGKGSKSSIETASDSVGDTSDDVEDTVVDDDVEADDET